MNVSPLLSLALPSLASSPTARARVTRLFAFERHESKRVCEPCHGACALAGMAVLRLYHHPTIATTTTITNPTTTSTIGIGREHGRGGKNLDVWRWMWPCMCVSGKRATERPRRNVERKIRREKEEDKRMLLAYLGEGSRERERKRKRATRKTLRDENAGEKERRISIGE